MRIITVKTFTLQLDIEEADIVANALAYYATYQSGLSDDNRYYEKVQAMANVAKEAAKSEGIKTDG